MSNFEWFWVGVAVVVGLESLFLGGMIAGQRLMAAGKPKPPGPKGD